MSGQFKEHLASFFGVQSRAAAVYVWGAAALAMANLAAVLAFVLPRWGQLRFLRLHYTVALGVDWVTDWRWLFAYPAAALAILPVNGWLAGRLTGRQRRLGLMMLAVTMLIEAFVLAGAGLAISLNG